MKGAYQEMHPPGGIFLSLLDKILMEVLTGMGAGTDQQLHH